MYKLLMIILLTGNSITLPAQYYYSDILAVGENKKQFQLLVKHRTAQVTVKAFDADGNEIKDFYLNQMVDIYKRTLTTYSKSSYSDASILKTEFNSKRFPVMVLDSSDGGSTTTRYEYDADDRITVLKSTSIQIEQQENMVTETRKYTYNEKGMPIEMIRFKGNTDSMLIKFVLSENGQPGEEQWWKNGTKTETWYYYYDDQDRLTDIVRYNAAVQRMLPEYMYGYDEKGNLTSKVTVQNVTGTFRIWQYTYDSRGLKIQETVLNRSRQPEGRLVFSYQ